MGAAQRSGDVEPDGGAPRDRRALPLQGRPVLPPHQGPFTPCDELEGSAEADLSITFEELVDGPLADLREVRPANTDTHG